MGRTRSVFVAVMVAAFVTVLAAPAMAGVTPGCTGSATIAGIEYTPDNDSPSNPIILPPGDVVVRYEGKTTFDNNGHEGRVWVWLGGIQVQVADWKDDDLSAPNEQSADGFEDIGDLREQAPFELRGLYHVGGEHSAQGGSCSGDAMVKFDGVVLDSPIALAAVGDTLFGLFLLLLATAATAKSAAAGKLRGRRLVGAIGGLLFGLGIALLAQQFSILPLTAFMLFGVPLLGMVLGILAATFPMIGRGKLAAAGPEILDLTKVDAAEAEAPLDLTAEDREPTET